MKREVHPLDYICYKNYCGLFFAAGTMFASVLTTLRTLAALAGRTLYVAFGLRQQGAT